MRSPATTQIFLSAALRAEASALIRHFGLKSARSHNGPELFEGDGVYLAVTGAGKIRAAAATAAFLALRARRAPFVAINAGIAAASPDSELSLGGAYLVNKISDAADGRDDYPDMAVRTPLVETSLTTVDAPVAGEAGKRYSSGAVDMEGSGFYRAAAMFLPPHRIACIKVISDHFTPRRVKAGEVREMITAVLPAVEETALAYRDGAAPKRSAAEFLESDWVREAAAVLRLTVTQQRQLAKWVTVFYARGGAELPDLSPHQGATPESKAERNRRFEGLRTALEI